jgi:hypothetical protein
MHSTPRLRQCTPAEMAAKGARQPQLRPQGVAGRPAQGVRAGEQLHTGHPSATVAEVHRYPGSRYMYDLTVDDLHTYYVLADLTPILVHNTGCGDDPDVPRYDENNLAPESESTEKVNGRPLRVGTEDTDVHFVGDRHGTWRDPGGRLHDKSNGQMTKDDNGLDVRKIDDESLPDKPTKKQVTSAETGPRAISNFVDARDKIQVERGTLWTALSSPLPTSWRRRAPRSTRSPSARATSVFRARDRRSQMQQIDRGSPQVQRGSRHLGWRLRRAYGILRCETDNRR